MEISHTIDQGIYKLALHGHFVLDGVTKAQDNSEPYLRDANLRGMLVNFDAVETIDSSGIGLTVMFHKRLIKHNAKLVLFKMKRNVREAYSITGIDQTLTVCDTEAEALEIINKQE